MLEDQRFDHYFDGPVNNNDISSRLRRYYEFWTVLVSLLPLPGVYTFVTGKSSAFALICSLKLGPRYQRPPSLHQSIVLGALSVVDITEAFDNSTTTSTNLKLCDLIKFSNDSIKQQFMAQVAIETAGQPRLVHYYLQEAAKHIVSTRRGPLDSATAIKEVLVRAEAMTEVLLNLSSNYTPNGDTSRDLFYALVFAGILDVPLNPRGRLTAHGQILPTLALIDEFNFYIVPTSRSTPEQLDFVRVRIAPCILRRMNVANAPSWVTEHQPGFLAKLSTESIPTSLLFGGELLEWLIRQRLIVMLLLFGPSRATWAAVVPAFDGTAFGGANLVEPPPNAPITTVLHVSNLGNAAYNIPHSSIKPEHVRQALQSLDKYVIAAAANKSKSPDLLIRFENHVVGFQAKYVGPEDALSFTELQEEINKSQNFGSSAEPLSLVIVAFSLGGDLQQWLNENASKVRK